MNYLFLYINPKPNRIIEIFVEIITIVNKNIWILVHIKFIIKYKNINLNKSKKKKFAKNCN